MRGHEPRCPLTGHRPIISTYLSSCRSSRPHGPPWIYACRINRIIPKAQIGISGGFKTRCGALPDRPNLGPIAYHGGGSRTARGRIPGGGPQGPHVLAYSILDDKGSTLVPFIFILGKIIILSLSGQSRLNRWEGERTGQPKLPGERRAGGHGNKYIFFPCPIPLGPFGLPDSPQVKV